jgi:ubiquinone/menaquinone biosynthesis C-methylase UbiE
MKDAPSFYAALGALGLRARKNDIHTARELEYIQSLLPASCKVLDAACGFGRLSIPLATAGYEVWGVDISPNLIAAAKEDAANRGVVVNFSVGDLRSLPYEDDSFDAAICMWSAFIEIVDHADQVKVLCEIIRVLAPGGIALFDMPTPLSLDDDPESASKGGLRVAYIDGLESHPMVVHDEASLKKVLDEAGIAKYDVFIGDFGGRDRLLMKFWKSF